MTYISDNIIPGNHGKVFGTDAKEEKDLKNIARAIMDIDGVKDVIIDYSAFPRELNVHTYKVVSIHDIEKAVNRLKFHVLPKGMFSL